jgi:putative radical SAM enzyme (TIGR03279 family)
VDPSGPPYLHFMSKDSNHTLNGTELPPSCNGLLVEKVIPGSIAAELEIEAGDRLLAINGHTVRDIIDYSFYSAELELALDIVKADGEQWAVELERDEGEQLGLIFSPPVPERCGNKCVFCFVHQLPRGLRAPLYVKDEDYRLSFLYGNYVTLANITSSDLARIKEQRLSPLYLSVHATMPDVRQRLLGKKGIQPILPLMVELASAGIIMHTQVVLCPGLNDGAVLERTVEDLVKLYPRVASVAIVPVGLTRHRKGLPLIEPVTASYARQFVDIWQPRSRELADRLGEPVLFLADEFYIKAGLDFPPLEDYGDLPQLENGVGMIPLFLAEVEEVLAMAEPLCPATVTVVTGESAYSYLADYLAELGKRTGVSFQLLAVPNRLFGENVTVTGLVAGHDIFEHLKGRKLGDMVLVPDVMIKEGEGVFLDDMSVVDLEESVGVPVVVVESTPAGIYGAVAEGRPGHGE